MEKPTEYLTDEYVNFELEYHRVVGEVAMCLNEKEENKSAIQAMAKVIAELNRKLAESEKKREDSYWEYANKQKSTEAYTSKELIKNLESVGKFIESNKSCRGKVEASAILNFIGEKLSKLY